MIKHRALTYKFVRRFLGTCALRLDSQNALLSVSSTHNSHKDLCFSLADRLIKKGSISSAQKVIRRLIIYNCSAAEAISTADFAVGRGMPLDLLTCSSLIRKLVISGEALAAEAFYTDCVINKGLEPNLQLLNSMIICYCKLDKVEEAKSCFYGLIERKCVPWVGACNAIIKSLAIHGRILESYGCFSEISTIVLDFLCYNWLVNGLCCRGFLDEGLHVFDVMIERGVRPSMNLCKSLVIGFSKWGRVEEAEILSTEMAPYGFVMDKLTYTYLINAYCKETKMKMAMRLFIRMLKMGCKPDTYTYNTLIHGFLNSGLLYKGWMFHNKMLDFGFKPNLITYQIILNKYCMNQMLDSALMLLDEMLQSGMTPNIHCYTVLITALLKEKRFEEADGFYLNMLQNGIIPDHVLFFTLVKNFPEGNEVYLALAFLKAIIDKTRDSNVPDSFLHEKPESVVDAMVAVENFLDHIARNNTVCANMAFSIYIIALCVGGKLEAALGCMEKMVNLGFSPLHTAFNSMLKLLFQKGLVQDAQSLLEIMQDHGLAPNQTTLSIVINEYCKQGDFSSAIDILDQMVERGIKPGAAIYNPIIGCLEDKRLFDL